MHRSLLVLGVIAVTTCPARGEPPAVLFGPDAPAEPTVITTEELVVWHREIDGTGFLDEPDLQRVVFGDEPGTVRALGTRSISTWSLETEKVLSRESLPLPALHTSLGGDAFVMVEMGEKVEEFSMPPVRRRVLRSRFAQGGVELPSAGAVLAVGKDGIRIVQRGEAGNLRLLTWTGSGYSIEEGEGLHFRSSASLSPDGKYLVVLPPSRHPEIWTTVPFRRLHHCPSLTVTSHPFDQFPVAFAGDSGTVAILGHRGVVHGYGLADGQLTWVHEVPVSCGARHRSSPAIALSQRGDRLAVGYGHVVQIVDIRQGLNLAIWQRPSPEIREIRFSPDDSQLGILSCDGRFTVHDLSSGEILHPRGGITGPCEDLRLSPGGGWLVTRDARRVHRFHVPEEGQPDESWMLPAEELKGPYCPGGDGPEIGVDDQGHVFVRADGSLRMYTPPSRRASWERKLQSTVNGTLQLIAEPGGESLLLLEQDALRRLDAKTGSVLREMAHVGDAFQRAIVHGANTLVISITWEDRELIVTEAWTGRVLQRLPAGAYLRSPFHASLDLDGLDGTDGWIAFRDHGHLYPVLVDRQDPSRPVQLPGTHLGFGAMLECIVRPPWTVWTSPWRDAGDLRFLNLDDRQLEIRCPLPFEGAEWRQLTASADGTVLAIPTPSGQLHVMKIRYPR